LIALNLTLAGSATIRVEPNFTESGALLFAIIEQRFFRQLIKFPSFSVGFNLSGAMPVPRLHEF
jgi:hypothetical protein